MMSRPDSATSSSSSSTSSHQGTSSAQLRKIKKPMIERRRRERINVCLNQLKSLVLEALKKNESSYSKMEKADILEMTVAHLKSMQQRHLENDPKVRDREGSRCQDGARYIIGFRECANEVEKYLTTLSTVDRPGLEVLASLTQYLRGRIEDVQKTVRNGSEQLHPVLDASSFLRSDSQMQFQTALQPSKVMARECNDFQPTVTAGTTCFRISDNAAPASATIATRYILGQLPYLQHPYATLTQSLPITDQSHFVSAAAASTLVRREHLQSPRQGDEFPQTLGVRIPRGSGTLQCHPRDAQISPDSGISLDSPTRIYRSKSVKSESMVEFSPQSVYKIKPSSQLETMDSGPLSDCLWRPW